MVPRGTQRKPPGGQVLADHSGHDRMPVAVADERVVVGVGAVAGSVVPVRHRGMDASVLAPDYQWILDLLTSHRAAMDCRELAAALGLEQVPGTVEGVRSKAKRLAARQWLVEESPGMFSVSVEPGGDS